MNEGAGFFDFLVYTVTVFLVLMGLGWVINAILNTLDRRRNRRGR